MTSKTRTDFIGREHEINWLKAAWIQVCQGKSQVCVLRGESGFGKTRIVQAFYSWLSSDRDQDPQGYWPDVLLKDGNNLRLNPPPASFGDTKTLPWLWWGVRWRDPEGQNLSELSSCALIDGLHHLEPHREALLARREKLKRTGKVAAELGTVAGELLSFGFLGAGKSLVELELRKKHGVTVLAVRRDSLTFHNPEVDSPFYTGDILYVMGAPDKLAESAKLFNCEGDFK